MGVPQLTSSMFNIIFHERTHPMRLGGTPIDGSPQRSHRDEHIGQVYEASSDTNSPVRWEVAVEVALWEKTRQRFSQNSLGDGDSLIFFWHFSKISDEFRWFRWLQLVFGNFGGFFSRFEQSIVQFMDDLMWSSRFSAVMWRLDLAKIGAAGLCFFLATSKTWPKRGLSRMAEITIILKRLDDGMSLWKLFFHVQKRYSLMKFPDVSTTVWLRLVHVPKCRSLGWDGGPTCLPRSLPAASNSSRGSKVCYRRWTCVPSKPGFFCRGMVINP